MSLERCERSYIRDKRVVEDFSFRRNDISKVKDLSPFPFTY